MTESGYPAPPASPTPLSPAEPFRDCKRTPGLTGCDPSAPVMAGHVAFYDMEGGQLVGVDLKTGEGWAVAMPVPESLEWSPDGSQLLVQMNYPREEAVSIDYIVFDEDGKVLEQLSEDRDMQWQPRGAELRKSGENKIVRSENGEEAQLALINNARAIQFRDSKNAEWQTEPLDVAVQSHPLEIYGWIPRTPIVIIEQYGSSTYSYVAHGENFFLFNTQTKELTLLRGVNGHLEPQFYGVQGSEFAIIQINWVSSEDKLAVLDGRTGMISYPLPRVTGEKPQYLIWQLGWQPENDEKEGLFALMVRMVETNWKGVIPSELFPTGGIYLYNRAENQAQMIREIPKEMLGGNFHFTADGRYLLYSVTPMDMQDGAETLMYVREMDTGKEWLLFDGLHNPRTGIGGIYWNLIAVWME